MKLLSVQVIVEGKNQIREKPLYRYILRGVACLFAKNSLFKKDS